MASILSDLLGKKIGERGARYLARSMSQNVGLNALTLHRSMSGNFTSLLFMSNNLGISEELRSEVKHELDINKNQVLRDSKGKSLRDSREHNQRVKSGDLK